MDTLFFSTVAAAGMIGWLKCYRDPRVFWAWKWVVPFALFFLSIYLFFTLMGANLAWWNGTTMDRPIVALCLAPILAWPVKARQPEPLPGPREVMS